MLSIFLLSVLSIIVFVLYRKYGAKFLGVLAILSFVLFMVESFIYLYFVFLVFKADCFALIGNQRLLDTIIKARIIYSTYYAQGKAGFFYRLDNDLGFSANYEKHVYPYKLNNKGIRSNKEYTLVPKEETLRLAVFGDSFVFGDDEKNQNTWPFILEKSVTNFEVLNFGMSGYGLGQSYLRYLKDGLKFNPDIILFNYVRSTDRDGVIPEVFITRRNLRVADIYRMKFWIKDGILMYRAVTPFDLFDADFRSKEIYKPLNIDIVSLSKNKVLSRTNIGLLIKKLYIDKKAFEYVPSSLAQDKELNEAFLEDLLQNVKKFNKKVIFIDVDFGKLPKGVDSTLEKYKDNVILVDREGIFKPLYRQYGVDTKDLLNKSSHYNPLGNQIYAQAVLEILKTRSWGYGDRVFKYNAEETAFEKIPTAFE